MVDRNLLKETIQVYATCGFKTADIIKHNDDYEWKGDKNLEIYELRFEKALIERVYLSYIFNNISLEY